MIKGPLHRSITSFIAPSLRRHHFSSTTFEMASASTQNAPTADENSALIKALVSLSAKNSKLVRSTTYDVPSAGMKITSWKMNEFKYYDIPSPFPTLARGLFTRKVDDEYAIVVRGYDKFFNIGEVPWTTWPSIKAETKAPYTLSLKSNGCIIFIAALTRSQLLVTSKHSLGPVTGVALSHAQAGEGWLEKHLEKAGKTKEELAAVLFEKNWTAIAELCDDNFEEHVLGYPPEKTGLHLHGINLRSKDFATQPTEVVDAFADEWGFIKTPTIVLDTIEEVQEFTDNCAKTGQWNGEAVEGFVVRTTISVPPTKGKGVSPYQEGSSFFFKVKFDEPYMMYRDWREVTKSLLSNYAKLGKPGLSVAHVPKSKLKRAETQVYVRWVIDDIQKHFKDYDEYTKGKGIIATREKFLAWLASDKGKQEIQMQDAGEVVQVSDEKKAFGKTIIVPVAIPGCGKTAVAVALSHLFGFGHTQSDDVKAKKAAPQFIKNVVTLLKKKDVVIADKNNHLKQHRQQLREAAAFFDPPVRLLALNWSLDSRPPAMIHRVCVDRVISRGENHQSLIADSSDARSHEEVLWMFINNTQELETGEVDASIEMDLDEGLEDAVRRAVKGVIKILELPAPSEEEIKAALEKVLSYEPSSKAAAAPPAKANKQDPRYYALLPELDFRSLLDERLGENAISAEGFPIPDEISSFWRNLKGEDRVTKRPHVTVVHSKAKDELKELWDACRRVRALTGEPPLYKAKFGQALCDGRVLCLTVDELKLSERDEEDEAAKLVLEHLPESTVKGLHVTVGTRHADFSPFESKSLTERWRAGDREGIWSVDLGGVEFVGAVKGLMG